MNSVHPRAAASALRFALCLLLPVAACAEGGAPGGDPGQPDGGSPDAPGTPDAEPGAPDADPGSPDAGPPPDAGPRQTRFEFQDGVLPTTSYRGTTDTEIDETEPSDVAGNDQVARIDGAVTIGFEDRFALVRWELTGIPSSARVRTVKMALFATDYPGSQSYQVRALKREWDEGHATWERATETQLWQRAGAKGGDDLADVEFTTLSPDQNGPFEVTFNAAGVAAVQRWVSDPATNFGLLLGQESNVDGMAIATSEAFEAANRPKLIIEIE